MADSETINVVVALNISDAILNRLREVSPRLHVERLYPTVPDKAWTTVDILFTSNVFPKPEHLAR